MVATSEISSKIVSNHLFHCKAEAKLEIFQFKLTRQMCDMWRNEKSFSH